MKFYVHYKTTEEIYGDISEYEGYIGPFDTEEKAWKQMESMDQEEWISGVKIYYCTYVCSEKEKNLLDKTIKKVKK